MIGAARGVMDLAAEHFGVEIRYEERKIGGAALRDEGAPVSDETLEAARSSDSVLLGAVGHPDFDDAPVRPEAGLLGLRKHLGAFANLRPVAAVPSLLDSSPLTKEIVSRRRRAMSGRATCRSTRGRRSNGWPTSPSTPPRGASAA